YPALGLEFLQLDTRLAPFDRPAVREALNDAVDRRAIVRLFGGSAAATPTCPVIPPGVPGYPPDCPYTLHPGGSGRWRAPNIARARALVAASHTRGEAISLWSSTDDPAEGRRVLAYVARVLDRLGYRARVRVVSRPELDRSIEQGRVQGAANEWYGGETGAGEFLQDRKSTRLNSSH